ncbi:type IX secretion system membrane protein PorP/SprF [Chitinophaga agrisoli]|uniref:Type IX secretion system membrane protein PorP/SprF n=1 Tax=Chitinophaga agrisoli TaxID=2607653 RepID=A0A5B2VUN5_9BACT|nr:type IX secretion system membrane protein PorP/SprF [Chitinophaga agrisoli]KAA2241987.1 type IX secretion system membrane protein PorP/SprF [Chitinophaga agrisoli]
MNVEKSIMKVHKRLFRLLATLLLAGCCYLPASAQQDPIYTQYQQNMMVVNPAYSSVDEAAALTLVGRNQWVGVDGAPKTINFSFYTPFKSTNTSLGFSAMNEKITVQSRTSLNFHISQRIYFNETLRLALGLKLGMSQFRENNTDLTTTDPVFADNASYFKTDVGFGFMLFNDRFYVGLSSPTFQSFDVGNKVNKLVYKTHYYLQGGYLFDAGEETKIKPSVQLRRVDGASLGFDINMSMLIKEMVWVGLSYRSEKTVAGMVQVQLNPNLQLGYSYDTPLSSNLKGAQASSHELLVSYRFTWSSEQELLPRYF